MFSYANVRIVTKSELFVKTQSAPLGYQKILFLLLTLLLSTKVHVINVQLVQHVTDLLGDEILADTSFIFLSQLTLLAKYLLAKYCKAIFVRNPDKQGLAISLSQ